MGTQPGNIEVLLHPCCKASLTEIRETLRRGGVLQGLVASSGLLCLFGSAPLDALVSITTTDWGLFKEATKGAGAIVRHACRQIAYDDFMRHPGGKLSNFWEKLTESFE